MDDEGSKARAKGKRPCVENSSSASATAAGSKARVKGKRRRASATAAADSGNHSTASDFRNLNPCDPKNSAGGKKALYKPRTTLYSDDCPYAFAKEHPNEVRYDLYVVGTCEVIRKAVRDYPPMKDTPSIASPKPIPKGPVPRDDDVDLEKDPDYRAAVASGGNVISYGSTWMLTIK